VCAEAKSIMIMVNLTVPVDGLVRDDDTTFGHHLLHVTQAQREPVIQGDTATRSG
jgi:hypothetical protein